MRWSILRLVIGAALGAFIVVFVEATTAWGHYMHCGCEVDVPPSIEPAFWSWSSVSMGWAFVGAFVGVLFSITLQLLSRREQRRRRDWGEL